jgi:hypothetical protein
MTSTKPNKRWAPLLLATGLAMSAMGLHAQSLTPRTCEAWNTARKANLSSAVQREWPRCFSEHAGGGGLD